MLWGVWFEYDGQPWDTRPCSVDFIFLSNDLFMFFIYCHFNDLFMFFNDDFSLSQLIVYV